MTCRHCHAPLEHVFIDLGFAPPSNAYLTLAELSTPEVYFPLKLYVCTRCWLVQTEDHAHADQLFGDDYAYFSSVSQIWRDHAANYAAMIVERLQLGAHSFVIEVAANDGYLLRHFVAKKSLASASSPPQALRPRPRNSTFRSCRNSSARPWPKNWEATAGRRT